MTFSYRHINQINITESLITDWNFEDSNLLLGHVQCNAVSYCQVIQILDRRINTLLMESYEYKKGL